MSRSAYRRARAFYGRRPVVRFVAVGLTIALTGAAHAREYRGLTRALLIDTGITSAVGRSISPPPARTRDGSKPPDATARCRDGTWSYSHTP